MLKGGLNALIKYLNNNIGKTFIDHKDYERVYFIKNKLKKNKNILLFSHEMKRTGAPIVLLEMAKLLKKKSNVIVFSLEDGDLVEDFIKLNIPVVISTKMKKYQLSSKINSNISFYLDDIISDFDLCVFNTLTLFNYIKRYSDINTKIIWWIHEGTTIIDIPEVKKNLPKVLSSNISTYFVSEYSSSLLKARGFDYGDRILSYGIKKDKIDKKSLVVNNNRIKYAIIGSINYRKGTKIVVDAIKSLDVGVNNKSEYYFVGKADIDDKYGLDVQKELVELDKNNSFVHYYSSLEHSAVLALIRDVDAVIVPSYDDPLPVVATEALMLNKALICSSTIGTISFLTNNVDSIIFDNSNFINLMKVIEEFSCNNMLRSKISKNGFKVYKYNFKYCKFIKNVKKIIK